MIETIETIVTIETKIGKIYENFIVKIQKEFDVSNIEVNKNKVKSQMMNLMKDEDHFKREGPVWATNEKVKNYIRTVIIPTSSLKINIKEEDLIRLYMDKWGLERKTIFDEELVNFEISLFRSGKFVKDLFSYKYGIEFEETNDIDIFYKKLYLLLPNDLEKTKLFSNAFGRNSCKYKKVVLFYIECYFSEKLEVLKQIVENSFDEITEMLVKEINLTKEVETIAN